MANVDHDTTHSPAATAEPGTVQVAQASGEPIGQISSAEQAVHVTHADGSSEDLGVGGQIYANDVIRTAPDGAVGITFVDGTQFSLGSGAEMKIDKLIYDPSGSDNSLALNVVQGAFVFVTGGIAGAPGEGMTVGTPAGSIGVRGTSVGGHYGAGPEGWVIALLKDADGHVGKVVVYNGKGEVVLDQVFQSTTLIDFNTPPATPQILTKDQIEGLFGKPLENLPDIQLQNELLDKHGELDINTAAGGFNGPGGPNHGSHFFTPTGFGDFSFGLLGLLLPPSTLNETQLGYNSFFGDKQDPNDKQFGNSPPLFGLALGGGHIPENSPDGTIAGFVAAIVGGPPNATYTYSLLDQHGNQTLQIFSARSFALFAEPEPAFTIDPNTGVITVNNSALLDFETTPGFTMMVHAQNNFGQSVNVPFEIDLEDENDNPPVIDPLGPVDLPENSPAGTVVATVTATDADTTGGPTQFSIVASSDPNGWFAINPETGEITLTAAGAASPLLDFESGIHTTTIQVAATDGTNAATPIDVEIDVTDLLEPVWSISGASEVTEGGTAAYFVSYSGAVLAPGQTLTVEVAPGSGTAISGTDFVGDSITLTFTGGGATSQSIGVSTIDDTIIEGTEDFSVTISNPNAGTIATPTDNTTLLDNQEPLVWDVTGNSAGTEGTVATYTVSYSGATLADGVSVTVTVSSHSGSATQDQDFGGVDQVLTFTGGEATSQTITVSLLADSTVEDPENFTVSLSSDTGDTGEATTTTVIDDPSQPIAWSLAGTDTVEEGGTAVYTVSYLGGPIALGATATVTIASSSGSAQDGEDFSGLATVLTFVGGDPTSQTVSVAAIADTVVEGTEDFSVAITGVSGGSVDSGTVATDIVDQSSGPTWSIDGDSSVAEGDAATYTVSYSGASLAAGQTVLVTVDTASGSAGEGSDFDGEHVVLTFTGGGESAQTLTVQTQSDTQVEGTEDFSVGIAPSLGGTGTGSITTEVLDQTTGPVWSLTGDSSVAEGSDATYTVSYTDASLAPGQTAFVTVDTTPGSANEGGEGGDYQGEHVTLTFVGGGETSQTLSVHAQSDTVIEGTEDFSVGIAPSLGGIGAGSVTTEIVDQTTGPTWSLSGDSSVAEGDDAIYTVSYSDAALATGQTAFVTVDTAPGTAEDGSDFDGGQTILTFVGGGETAQTLAIHAEADTLVEGTEDFSVAIAPSLGDVGAGSVTTAIVDQTTGPTWSLSGDSSVAEGEDATYTVSYGGAALATGQTAFVTVDTTPGSAEDGSDYDGGQTILTFVGGGETAQTLAVHAEADTVIEGTEDFSVGIAASLGDVGAGSVTTEIVDQTTGPTWNLTGDSSVAEGDDATYTVSYGDASLAVGQTAFVTVDTTPGSANEGGEGGDYQGEHVVLTFVGGGETAQTLVVHAEADTVIEGTEDFSVGITPSLGDVGTGSVTTEIVDQTTGPTWNLTGDSSVTEGDDATYTVSYSDAALAAGQTVFVTVDTAPGSAEDGSDYDGGQTILTFVGGGETAQTLAVHAEADTIIEGTEDFSVGIAPSVGDIGTGSVTTEIIDHTTGPVWNVSGDSSVAEGDDATYTVGYEGASLAPGQTAFVTVATAPGSAEDGSDYGGGQTILTFIGGGETAQTLTIHAETDTVIEGTEDFSVGIVASSGEIGTGSVTTEITDETTGPLWTLSGDSSVTEGDDATYTVSYSDASLAPGQTVLVTVDTASGTAGEGEDFTGDHSVLTFTGGGESTQTLVIHTTDDTVAEDSEDYSVSISPSQGAVGAGSVTTTIIDNDDPDRLLVGTDSANNGPGTAEVSSTSPYANLVLQGGRGQDILIGDSGGATHHPASVQYEDQNGVAVLDKSGSVADSNVVQLSKSIVLSLAQKYATYAHDAFVAGQDVTVKFTVIPFNGSAGTAITVTAHGLGDLVETSPGSGIWQFASLATSVNAITASGNTDFQDALLAARNQLLSDSGLSSNSNYAPLTGFDGNNRLFFISDGHPTEQASTFQQYDSPTGSSGLDYWRGVWTALGVESHAIGIGLTAQSGDFANLQKIDNSGGAEIVTAADQVGFALEGTFQPGADIPDAVGGDSLSGGNGQDIIFGDVVNTDHLDASTVTGEGYEALFTQIQSDLGHAPNDQEVLSYIRTHLDVLYEDNDPRGAADHIDAGAGDDTVFAQGGNDTVIGGTGADLLDGGTGNDRIVADAVAGTPDGAVDTLIGGMGSDILVGADGEPDYFQWKAGHRGAEGTTGLHAQSGTTFSEGSGEITVTTTLGDPHNIHYFTFEVTGTEAQALTIDLKSLSGNINTQIYLFQDSNGNGLVGSSAADPLISANNDDSGLYGIASDGSSNGNDSFIVQGQLAPGKYILAIGDSTLTETEARSNDSVNGNSNNGSGSGQYQLTITGQNVDLTGGHGLAQGFIPDPNDDTDTVQGFQIGGPVGSRDVLDFSDLLSGAPHTGAGATAANLSSYFDVSFSGGNTILSVDYNGAAGPAGSGFDPQLHVVLQGVSQASWGGTQDETQVLTTLLANGQLTT